MQLIIMGCNKNVDQTMLTNTQQSNCLYKGCTFKTLKYNNMYLKNKCYENWQFPFCFELRGFLKVNHCNKLNSLIW